MIRLIVVTTCDYRNDCEKLGDGFEIEALAAVPTT
jgi:hypothetical protein